MNNLIIDRQKIELPDHQNKMIISGWGKKVFDNSTVEKITYLSDGLKIKGYIAYPIDDSKKYPCIIWNRGGFGEKGAIDKFTARGIFGQLANWGYVVFASQYRGNAGSEGSEQFGGDDVNDILNLIKLASEIPQADTTNWGIEGWSRGGMMTYLTLLKNPNFKCAILSGAISNLKKFVHENPEKSSFYKNLLDANSFNDELEKRTIINFVDKLPKIPYLLMHGKSDETVSPAQTIEMAEKMDDLKIPHELVLFEGGDHFLKNHRTEVDRLRKEWFNKYLK
jgi:dipeptidyl aminopeptidase/acylaminoacyl peptidase